MAVTVCVITVSLPEISSRDTLNVGDGGFPIQIGGDFLYHTDPDVSCMYPACIVHVFIKIHQDTSRYNKIHLYLSLWPSKKMYLT
jgi:hypothetical protein